MSKAPGGIWTVHTITTTAQTPDGEFWLAIARVGEVCRGSYARSESMAIGLALQHIARAFITKDFEP